MVKTLFKGGTILTMDSTLGELAKGDLLVSGCLIEKIAKIDIKICGLKKFVIFDTFPNI